MNFWTPEFHVWGEGLDASDMPWYLLYDYVEVFTYDHEENEFHLHWRDNFDTFNKDRWHKSSGGFDQNSSVFYPENVSVKGGNLVLKMEPDTEHHEVDHHSRHDRHSVSHEEAFETEVRHHHHRAHLDENEESYESGASGDEDEDADFDDYRHECANSDCEAELEMKEEVYRAKEHLKELKYRYKHHAEKKDEEDHQEP